MYPPIGSTMAWSDVYPNYNRAAPDNSQPQAAAASAPALAGASENQPAYVWLAMIALLVVARVLWEKAEG